MLTPCKYTPSSFAFEQRECSICLDEYTENESMIVQLACKHIYHVGCLTDSIVRCPMCHHDIEGRVKNYNKEEIRGIVDEIKIHLLQLIPSIKDLVDEERLREASNVFADGVFEELSSATYQTNIVEVLKEFNALLNIIKEGNIIESANLIGVHANNFIKEIKSYHTNHPVNIEEETLEQNINRSFDIAKDLLKFCDASQKLIGYVSILSIGVMNDARVKAIFEERKQTFIELHRNKLSTLSLLERYRHVIKLDFSSRKMLSTVPEVQTAMTIRKYILSIIISGSVAAFAYSTFTRT